MRTIQTSFQVVLTCVISGCLGLLLISGLPWSYILGFLTVMGFGITFFVNPLLLLGGLLFFRAGIDSFLVNIRFLVSGVDLGLGGGFSLMLVVLTFVAFLIDRDETFLSRINHTLIKLLASFCFFTIFNATYSFEESAAFKIILRNFSMLTIVVLCVMKVRKDEDAQFLLKAITWSFIPSIAIGFISGDSLYKEIRGMRYCASLSHPNILAFYLLVVMACLLAGFQGRDSGLRSRLMTSAGLTVLLGMLVYTRTRGGYAASVILFLSYSWFNNRRLIIPVVVLCACALLLPVVNDSIFSLLNVDHGKVSLNEESSFAWRLEKWGYLLKEGINKPILGHGLGASKHFGTDSLAAHNVYIQFFLESGIVGLFLYFAPYVYLIISALRTRKQEPQDSLLFKTANFFLIFIPSFLIMSISENLASYVIIQWYFWAVVGIFISLTWRKKHAQS